MKFFLRQKPNTQRFLITFFAFLPEMAFLKEKFGMLIFILIPLIIARIKGYRVLSLFQVCDIYPFLLVCATHAFFILNAWIGNYGFVQYASLLQNLMILTLLIPIIRRRIFTPTMVGAGLTIVGTVMNNIVIKANGGKMPVYPTVSRWIGYYKEGQLDGNIDSLHVLLDSESKLPFLADYIDFGVCILSPGDLLIHAFASIIIYYTVKSVCRKEVKEEK